MDVLRAFALFGIVITHSAMGFLAGPPPDPLFNTFSVFDKIIDQLVDLLTFGKFFTIFSFLFGLSFAIQLENANRKGTAFSGRFVWRLIVLLAIGFVHNAFFSGDILMIYALLGLLLIPCRNLGNRTLVVVALILVLNIPGLVRGVAQVSAPPPTPEQQQLSNESRQQFMQDAQRQFDIKQSGSLGQVVTMNVTESSLNKLSFQILTGRLWITFGLFLLGLYAGRLNVFRDTPANRDIFRRLLLWAGVIAAITTVIAVIYPSSFRVRSFGDVSKAFSFSVQQASLSTFYVAAITLLFWKKPSQGLLPALAPLGKNGTDDLPDAKCFRTDPVLWLWLRNARQAWRGRVCRHCHPVLRGADSDCALVDEPFQARTGGMAVAIADFIPDSTQRSHQNRARHDGRVTDQVRAGAPFLSSRGRRRPDESLSLGRPLHEQVSHDRTRLFLAGARRKFEHLTAIERIGQLDRRLLRFFNVRTFNWHHLLDREAAHGCLKRTHGRVRLPELQAGNGDGNGHNAQRQEGAGNRYPTRY